MTPEEAKFILEHDSGMGCQLARLSLRHENGMWKTLFDAGLPTAIRKNSGARNDLLYTVGHLKNTANAVTVLRAILDDIKPKQRAALFTLERQGSVLITDWLGAIGRLPDAKGSNLPDEKGIAHFRALAEVVNAYGIELNTTYHAKGRRGGSFETSVLSQAVSDVMSQGYNDPRNIQKSEQMELIWQLSPKLDDATKIHVLQDVSIERVDAVVTLFQKNGWARREDWLSAAGSPRVNKQTVAYLQAKVAMEAVEEVTRVASRTLAAKR